MHDLVEAASLALSVNDANALEKLAADARMPREHPTRVDLAKLARAAHVLAAQVHAASLHLEMFRRGSGRTFIAWKANPWEL